MRIAGAGGTGSVGKLVVERARAAGHDVVVISRSHGVDLTAGAGLDDALKNVATVIDVSNIRTVSKRAPIQFFETTTRNLLKAEQWCGVNHHVLPSIVGIDRVNWGYYQGKRRQEGLVLAGPVPATILRARVRGPHNFVVSVPWPSAAGWSMANGGLLPADEFSFHLFQSDVARDIHDFRDERARETSPAILGMHQDAHAPDVPFPTAELLVQRGVAEDFSALHRDEREVAARINVLAPVADDGNFRDAVFDEQLFLRRHGQEELVKGHLVGGFEQAGDTSETALEGEILWVVPDYHFE